MSNIVLRKLSTPQKISNHSILNTVKPLTYSEWAENNIGIIPEQAHEQYEKYLIDWNEHKKDQSDLLVDSAKLKNDYVALLKQLQIIFKDDPNFGRISNIDFDSQLDIKIAIPFFARKLKEIALYYVEQRELLKKAKIQYNLVGSNNALNRILYENLLNAFTKKEQNVRISAQQIYNTVPALSSIISDFSIEIEELHDMTNYFDYNNKPDETGIYDLVTDNPLLFVLQDYIKRTYNVLNTNEVPLSGRVNPLALFDACEQDNTLNIQLQSELNKKYVGNDIFYLTGGYYDWDVKNVKLDMSPGNNFFYWFSGQQVQNIPDGVYLSTALSSINYINATGAPNISAADIVFMSVGNILTEGAWLLDSDIIVVNDVMSATMMDGKLFKFAYPGKGTSAEGSYWTGKTIADIKADDKRFFPSESAFLETTKKINDLYWSNTPSLSVVQSILLQDTTLYSSGAYAGKTFKQADKILIYPDDYTTDSPVFAGNVDIGWLYDFTQTNIPIKMDTNNLYYPLTAYEKVEELFFRYENGDAIALSALNVGASFSGAIAGDNINNSDLLIKLNSVCGPEVEVAWLKGFTLSAFSQKDTSQCSCDGNYQSVYTGWRFDTGVTQPGLSFKCSAGDYIRFLWTGPTTNINDVRGFTGFDHDASCEYHKSNDFSSILELNFLKNSDKGTYEKWKTCNCKAVNYSPMGHKGNSLMAYNYATDFIVKDAQFPDRFNINFWKGADGKGYKESSDLAWFNITDLKEPDLGWGKGVWKANDDSAFILETGKTYIYYRSDLNRCNFTLPYFVINEGYTKCVIDGCTDINCVPVWQKAIINIDGLYVDAGQISDMSLESGNFYTYIHRRNYDYSKLILNYDGNRINTVSGNFVTLSAVDPLIQYEGVDLSMDAINFVIKIPLTNAAPYWGVGSSLNDDNTRNKHQMFGSIDFHIDHEYLQIRQPFPSNILLTDDKAIEYKLSDCNSCFIWKQPLSFDVQSEVRRWNKILFDNCVKSDILDYLYGLSNSYCSSTSPICYSVCPDAICGCIPNCFSTKTGVTATNIPSEIVFNTELSGIPVFVNYFARNASTLLFDVIDVTNGTPPTGGKWYPPVSSIFIKAENPWKNIINDFYSSVASEESNEQLYSEKELGLFTPNRLATEKYELHDAQKDIYLDNVDPLRLFRENNYTDDVFEITGINSDWMKHKQGQNVLGQIKTNKRQTFHPYITNYQQTNHMQYGMFDSQFLLSPWDENGQWINQENFPANLTGLYPLKCGTESWFTSQFNLSGNVIEWQSDVYGNQHFLMNSSGSRLNNSSAFNSWFIKGNDETLYSGSVLAEEIINKYKNILF